MVPWRAGRLGFTLTLALVTAACEDAERPTRPQVSVTAKGPDSALNNAAERDRIHRHLTRDSDFSPLEAFQLVMIGLDDLPLSRPQVLVRWAI
jgi:hypothetical protein